MNDRNTLIATAVFIVFFLISGMLSILYNPVIKVLLFGGFLAIIISLIINKSKEEEDNKKNLPN